MFPCNTKVSLLSCAFTTHSVFFFYQRIEPDQHFWEEKSVVAEKFVKTVILPELLGKCFTRNNFEVPHESAAN
jgi:hypothetical protein